MRRPATMLVGPIAAAIMALALPTGASAHSAPRRHARREAGSQLQGYGTPPHAVPFGRTATDLASYGEMFAPTQLEGANVPCTPSREHPYPVVLVHGTLADEASNWVTLAPMLANLGYCVYALNYGQTNSSLDDRIDGLGYIPYSAQQLATFVSQVLAQTGASQVDIVGHSQGGMMPNYYIKFLGGASKVHLLIGLAPSNHGTDFQGLFTKLTQNPVLAQFTSDLANDAGVTALVQQGAGSPFETNLFAGGDTVAGPRYVVIETEWDEVVTPWTNAFLHGPNVTNIMLQSQCPADPVEHIGLYDDWPALQDVVNQLSDHPQPGFQPTCNTYGQSY